MIYLIGIFVYSFLFILIYILIRIYLIRYKKSLPHFFRKNFLKVSLFLLPIFLIFSYLYVSFRLMESHHNINKGSLLWFITMDNSVINDFPIIENMNTPKYNWIGSDAPSINGGWELEYNSLANIELLESKILNYLEHKKFKLKKTKEPNCNWSNYEEEEIGVRYTGINEKDECLDLVFKFNKLNMIKVEISLII